MKYAILLAAALALSGCATSRPIGSNTHSIHCGAAGVDQCYEQALKTCPGGFDMIHNQGSRYLGQTASVGIYGGFSTPIIAGNNWIVSCK